MATRTATTTQSFGADQLESDRSNAAVPQLPVPAPPIDAPTRASRARIPLTNPKGLTGKALTWFSTRKYGQVLDNLLAMAHNRRVLTTVSVFEVGVMRWNRLDPQLKALAVMAASVGIECSWCLDFGYYEAHSHGLDTEKIAAVPHWRTSNVFTGAERRVLAYAEAMTVTPPAVTDEMAEELRADLGDDGLAELTMMVAVENLRSRFNSALGLSSQGFSESCRVR